MPNTRVVLLLVVALATAPAGVRSEPATQQPPMTAVSVPSPAEEREASPPGAQRPASVEPDLSPPHANEPPPIPRPSILIGQPQSEVDRTRPCEKRGRSHHERSWIGFGGLLLGDVLAIGAAAATAAAASTSTHRGADHMFEGLAATALVGSISLLVLPHIAGGLALKISTGDSPPWALALLANGASLALLGVGLGTPQPWSALPLGLGAAGHFVGVPLVLGVVPATNRAATHGSPSDGVGTPTVSLSLPL